MIYKIQKIGEGIILRSIKSYFNISIKKHPSLLRVTGYFLNDEKAIDTSAYSFMILYVFLYALLMICK